MGADRGAASTPIPARRRLTRRAAAFPDAPGPWVDLSTGINPVPYPVRDSTRGVDAVAEPAEVAALQAAAAHAMARAPEQVVVGARHAGVINGCRACFPRAASPSSARPTAGTNGVARRRRRGGGGVPRAWSRLACRRGQPQQSRRAPLSPRALRALGARGARRPVHRRRSLRRLRRRCCAPDPPPATVVLRSFGKTYGLAGLRLGFAVARVDDRARLARGAGRLGGLGAGAGDRPAGRWPTGTGSPRRGRGWRATSRWLDGRLVAGGFRARGGTLLFRLAARADARAATLPALCAAGLLTRPFTTDTKNGFAFGCRPRRTRARVTAALRDLVQEGCDSMLRGNRAAGAEARKTEHRTITMLCPCLDTKGKVLMNDRNDPLPSRRSARRRSMRNAARDGVYRRGARAVSCLPA